MTLSATTDDRPRHAERAPHRRGPRASVGERLRAWTSTTWFLLPALLLFFFFVLIPIFVAFYTSFFRWGGFGWPEDFVGLGNYRKLADDPVFRGDLWRGLLIIVFSVAVQLPIALGTAVLLNQRMRGRAVYRAVFFAPYILSEVIAGVLFGIIFLPGDGLADKIVEDLPLLGGLAGKWFADPDTALPTLFAVMTWKYFGFHMMIYLAGLQGIPSEVLEAASIDGASPWRRFRSVTLPLLAPTLRISVFLSVIGSIQLFDLVWVTTTGGPTHSTETMAVTMFQFGFKRYQMGYAGAISVAMFLICMAFSLLYQRYALRRDLQGAVTSAGGRR
ncbi:carbohydrate ABC transporter permease [Actinomadura madurae]|uniref:carbohydrate ABC transporter permease n=1 Tax=Actinomadura madurae TaxID=1993 RepID=UPI0020269F6B|nr:sugar ABC transporter permease [Actinomadura madurae]MCQ0012218.1 sugar ABC transporter permease [Actinomadura madurae]URM92901.1 sugar ABC transporter permease [Actinomadura madurae]